MGALFAKKKVVWVPNNEKLEDKCSDAEGWQAVETFRGWKVGRNMAALQDWSCHP